MSMGKILVADDDQNIAELLKLYLEKEGYTVVLAADGMEANEKFAAENPDIVLLDIMMPKLDGWQVCRDIRKKSNCPIIMITAKGETFDKVLGLELGADDYIVKPFEAKEVVARIKATFRRLEKTGETPPVRSELQLHFAGLTVTPATMTVERRGKPVDLTPLEYQLLMYFYENRNVALSREKILEAVWGYDYFGNTRTVDIHVLRLRKKLGLDTEIRTIFKIGYIFDIKE